MKIARLVWRLLRYRVAIMLLLFLFLSIALHGDLSTHPWKLLFASAALAFSYISATSVNDIADKKIDAINHPDSLGRPLITGEAESKDVWLVFVLASTLSVIFAAIIGWQAVFIIALSILINVAYSLPPLRLSYRTFLAPLVLGVAYVGIPYILGIVIINRFSLQINDFEWLLGLYLMFVGRIILKDFRDRKGDAKYNKPTFLLLFGKNATCNISFAGVLSGGLILTWLVRTMPWLSVIVFIYLVAILGMLERLRRSRVGNGEQLSIGVGAKMGNGLLITLLGVFTLRSAGVSTTTQLSFAIAVSLLFFLNFFNFLQAPEKAVLGYRG